MKKFVALVVLLLSFGSFGISGYAAERSVKTVDKADISIISDGKGHYDITQNLTIIGEGGFDENEIEHTFATINGLKPVNLKVVFNGSELDYTAEEANSLIRYFVTVPDGHSGPINYEISYSLSVAEEIFTTPLFIPMYSTSGTGNVVKIEFETTDKNIVQRNSFPVLKKAEDNHVTSYMMNIPSHVNYVYGTTGNIFNSHNLYSWGAILVLLSIVAYWIRFELKSQNVLNRSENGKGVA
jgi:hypothetical protein